MEDSKHEIREFLDFTAEQPMLVIDVDVPEVQTSSNDAKNGFDEDEEDPSTLEEEVFMEDSKEEIKGMLDFTEEEPMLVIDCDISNDGGEPEGKISNEGGNSSLNGFKNNFRDEDLHRSTHRICDNTRKTYKDNVFIEDRNEGIKGLSTSTEGEPMLVIDCEAETSEAQATKSTSNVVSRTERKISNKLKEISATSSIREDHPSMQRNCDLTEEIIVEEVIKPRFNGCDNVITTSDKQQRNRLFSGANSTHNDGSSQRRKPELVICGSKESNSGQLPRQHESLRCFQSGFIRVKTDLYAKKRDDEISYWFDDAPREDRRSTSEACKDWRNNFEEDQRTAVFRSNGIYYPREDRRKALEPREDSRYTSKEDQRTTRGNSGVDLPNQDWSVTLEARKGWRNVSEKDQRIASLRSNGVDCPREDWKITLETRKVWKNTSEDQRDTALRNDIDNPREDRRKTKEVHEACTNTYKADKTPAVITIDDDDEDEAVCEDWRDTSKTTHCKSTVSLENTRDEASEEGHDTESHYDKKLSVVPKVEVSFEVDAVSTQESRPPSPPGASSKKSGTCKNAKAGEFYPCILCDESFTKFPHLCYHIYLHAKSSDAMSDEAYCTVCKTVFRGRNPHVEVDAHVREKHADPRPFKCTHCDKTFANFAGMRLHKRLHYKCEQCKRRFPKLVDLSLHMFQHLKLVAYDCHLCHRLFIDLKKFKYHLDSHSGNQDPKSNSKNRVKNPIKKDLVKKGIVKTDVVKKNRKCTACKQEFKTLKKLKAHMLKCSGQEQIKSQVFKDVSICENTPATRIQKPTGDRPFVCEFCGERFRKISEKRLHTNMKGHHR